MSYHEDISKLTKTQLATHMRSPVEFYHTYITRKMPKNATKPMATGSVCHAVLLEDHTLSSVFHVYPDSCLKSNGAINPGPAASYREDHPEVIAFGKRADEFQILSVLAAVRESKLGSLIELASEREEERIGEYNGRAIKCKPDFAYENIIYDLKFVAQLAEPMLERNFKRFQYWLQDAHYSACVGGDVTFRFWTVETTFPYRIFSRNYNAIARERAREKWEIEMDRFIAAEAANDWTEETHKEYDLSPWDLDANEEGELVDIGEAS